MEQSKKIELAISAVLSFVLFIIPWAYSMSVVPKWACWYVAFVAALILIEILIPCFRVLDKPQIIVVNVIVFGLFFLSSWPIAKQQWRTEQSTLLEGDLAPNELLSNGYPDMNMEMGDSGAIILWPEMLSSAPQMQIAYDAGLRMDVAGKELLITTTVRDRNGNLVVELNRNHWKVYPQFCSDKNYTKDALEVMDTRGHVVLQVRILSDRIRLQAEWFDDHNHGLQMMKSPDKAGGIFNLETPGAYSPDMIKRMFQYPSKDHWGEMARN